jgi:hypothetical protein
MQAAGTKLARPERLELPAYRFEVCRSIQLSYGRAPQALYLSMAQWGTA